MSRLPRRDLIEEPEVGIYHCVQRAVRRAFLCGQDAVTGQNFDHRKAWIQQRLEFLAGQPEEPTAADLQMLTADEERVAERRRRLSSLSWFMRCLAEPIARQANREDGCTGRFWERRYKCQRLLDEAAVLACSVYVDLNPIRAGVATTYVLRRRPQGRNADSRPTADAVAACDLSAPNGVPRLTRRRRLFNSPLSPHR